MNLKATNIDAIPTLIGTVCCVGILWFELTEIKGAKIILHVKLPTFRAAKLKGFYSTSLRLGSLF